MSKVETQITLETLYNKNETLPRLRAEFRDPAIVDHCQTHGIPIDFAIDLLAQMVLHKRATVSTLIGLLHHHFGQEQADFQLCADMLFKAAEVNLVDYDDLSKQFIVKIDVSEDVHEDLARYQFPLPMVVQPKEVKSNKDVGYFTIRTSVILRKNHHDDDVCLDHINRVNKTKLSINPDVARMVKNQWKNLERPKEGETKQEFDRRVKTFEKYDQASRDVMEHLFMAGNEFYLTHRYDKRGRCYAQGYHVNTQGNDWNKAVVEFAEQEIVQC